MKALLKLKRMDSLIDTVTEIIHHEAQSRRIVDCCHERLLVVRDKVEIIIGSELGDIRRRRELVKAVVDEPARNIRVEGWRDLIKEILWEDLISN
jgi:hypothetical protein